MGLRDITMKDVEDLHDMEGDKFDVLLATVQRAKQIHEAEERAEAEEAAAALNQQTPPKTRISEISASYQTSWYEGESSSSPAFRKRRCNFPKKREIEEQPLLPEEFKNKIEDMARGKALTPAKLVIQKGLFSTDVSSNHNRLSIPIGQIRDDFLTEKEKERLGESKVRKNHLEVRIVEPSGALEMAKFSRWDMAKSEGKKKSSCYVINGKWKDIVERNNLQPDMVVQLWCFRIDQSLCFALVRLPEEPRCHDAT